MKKDGKVTQFLDKSQVQGRFNVNNCCIHEGQLHTMSRKTLTWDREEDIMTSCFQVLERMHKLKGQENWHAEAMMDQSSNFATLAVATDFLALQFLFSNF